MDEKHNFLEIFENFHKNMLKTHYFCIFFKKFNKPCVNFSRVSTKNANCWEILKVFDENSIDKLNLYFIFIFFRKFVTKNRAFENNTIFLQQFFRFGGGGCPPPGYALDIPSLSRNRKQRKNELGAVCFSFHFSYLQLSILYS